MKDSSTHDGNARLQVNKTSSNRFRPVLASAWVSMRHCDVVDDALLFYIRNEIGQSKMLLQSLCINIKYISEYDLNILCFIMMQTCIFLKDLR